VALDGADEVDAHFNLIKGGGGAQAREKIVAAMADRFIVVVDEAKLVETLGAFGLPLEVLPFAPDVVAEDVMKLGAMQVARRTEPSDNGNVLLDAAFGLIADPAGLARRLESVPGLVAHGLFPSELVERVIVAGTDGVRELIRPR
jgi:ribose 5-phosphate isomerase A